MTTLPDNKELQSSARSSIAAPVTPLHEAVVKMVNDLVAQQLQQVGITFGKVTGQDGGAVRVMLDGEDDPRQVGFPRHVGVQYPTGSRVAVGTTNTGDKFVLGPVNDGTGKDAEAVVGSANQTNQNVADNSIDRNHLRNGAVQTQHLDSNAVTNSKIGSGEVQGHGGGSGGTPNIATGSVGKNDLEGPVQASLHNADTALQSVPNNYPTNSDMNSAISSATNNLAKESELSSYLTKTKASGASCDVTLKKDSNGAVTGVSVKLPNF